MSTAGHIIEADSHAHYLQARSLIEEYAVTLRIDLQFQGFAQECNSLPSVYAAPSGCLLLAYVAGIAQGCVGVRMFASDVCEMKRLYVRPNFRGHGLGRQLAIRAIEKARRLRYSRIVLDTLPQMIGAQALYVSLGFRECESYYDNPVAGTRYLSLQLSAWEPT